MKLNKYIILIMLFTAAVGICTGAFLEVSADENVKVHLKIIVEEYLLSDSSSSNFWLCFFNSVKVNLLLLLAAAAAPYIYITIPLLPLWLFIKSTAIGFSAAITLEAAGLAGMSHIAFRLMPQNMILLPALAVLAAAAAQAGGSRFMHIFSAGSRKRKALHYDARPYFIVFAYASAGILISCLLEAFLLIVNL